ncbi:hypothetical protein ACQCN2_14625 [Brevibacillus ginsengisoli]|uniref:hypothetical protein n=1 Tax=Brevibacillus ginsengisoli TaxID=363854 RepID=UPI003CE6C27A
MKLKLIAMVVLCVVLCFWCPWITDDFSKTRAVSGFNNQYTGAIDGCGSDTAIRSVKVPFGRSVEIDYVCMPALNLPQFHKKKTVYVSFLGTVHIDSIRPY